MAYGQATSNIREGGPQPSVLKDHEQPHGIREQAFRQSALAQVIQECKQSVSKDKLAHGGEACPSIITNNISEDRRTKASQHPRVLHTSYESCGKRKRGQEAGTSPSQGRHQPPPKRLQTSPSICLLDEQVANDNDIDQDSVDPLEYWVRTSKWPQEYFKQDSRVREDFERDSWLEEQMESSTTPVVQYVEINGYRYPRPIKKAPTSLRRKKSDSTLTGSSDHKKREIKSAAYRDTRYATLLGAKGSFLQKSHLGITDASQKLCQRLLESAQDVPKDSLFRDDLFDTTCDKIQDRNEARVIQDIGRLIVPSVETFATFGASHLDHLIEGVDEGWTGCIPVEGPRPQPDYCVGFRRSAFTNEQLEKLDPLIGSVFENSFFVATYRMYFASLTCEVKCGGAALDIADRQNAHSMTVAVRAIVELYRAVNREKELHREILAFSISHDHRSVRIYGHYAIVEPGKTTFYRHPIHAFDFSLAREKWTAYKFTKNVYDLWIPIQLKRICSAIEDLPRGVDFSLSQSASFPDSETPSSQQEAPDDIRSTPVDSQVSTPTTSFTQATEPASKKPRN
ncbi:MAG: hypothetical protein Q9178_005420 [Gyalolechia marmorata]